MSRNIRDVDLPTHVQMTKPRSRKKQKVTPAVEEGESDPEIEEEDPVDQMTLIVAVQAEMREMREMRGLYEEQVALSKKLELEVLSQTEKLAEIMNDCPSRARQKATTSASSPQALLFLSNWDATNSNLKVLLVEYAFTKIQNRFRST